MNSLRLNVLASMVRNFKLAEKRRKAPTDGRVTGSTWNAWKEEKNRFWLNSTVAAAAAGQKVLIFRLSFALQKKKCCTHAQTLDAGNLLRRLRLDFSFDVVFSAATATVAAATMTRWLCCCLILSWETLSHGRKNMAKITMSSPARVARGEQKQLRKENNGKWNCYYYLCMFRGAACLGSKRTLACKAIASLLSSSLLFSSFLLLFSVGSFLILFGKNRVLHPMPFF